MDYRVKNKNKKPKKRQPAKNYVVWLLSKQDYSIHTIRTKLQDKEYPESEIEELISNFIEIGYLDDKRYFRQILKSIAASKKGLFKAKIKAKEKGVPQDIVDEVIHEEDIDWFEIAKWSRQSKFGMDVPEDYALRNKQARFLVSRGFSYDEASYALQGDE